MLCTFQSVRKPAIIASRRMIARRRAGVESITSTTTTMPVVTVWCTDMCVTEGASLGYTVVRCAAAGVSGGVRARRSASYALAGLNWT